MRIARLTLALAAAVAVTPVAMAQRKTGIAESGLIGIKLFDSGQKLVAVYGTPDQVEPVNLGGAATGGGGGGGAPGGFGGAPGGRGGGGGGNGAANPGASPGLDWNNGGFNFADELLRQRGPSAMGGSGASGGPPPGYPGGSGVPGGAGVPGGGRTPGGGSRPGGGGGATEEVTFTRWVYNRMGSKYGFILDKQGRVIQIEAIGLQNGKVKTRAGLGFGSTFAQIIKAYGTPDSYEISGDNILMKYLQRRKVAFRLSRLGEKKPQVVTGVVVAAGKA